MLVFFGRTKIGLICGFCDVQFIGIGWVSVAGFPENDVTICNAPGRRCNGLLSVCLRSLMLSVDC